MTEFHDRQVASLVGKGYYPYHVDEDGTHLMKPRKPNSVPLNTAATVLTGGLWLVTAMPIISTSKTDQTRFVPHNATKPDDPTWKEIGLGALFLLVLVFVFWALGFLISNPIWIAVLAGLGTAYGVARRVVRSRSNQIS